MVRKTMVEITNKKLIERAASVVHPIKVGDRLFADVGCALVTDKENVYLGVCIDTAGGTGFCAEHSAAAAMITAGERRIKKIVATWKNDKGAVVILPPCGRCREFLRQIDEDNLNAAVILGENKEVKLSKLLPYHEFSSG
jgi:cytidine deaminase